MPGLIDSRFIAKGVPEVAVMPTVPDTLSVSYPTPAAPEAFSTSKVPMPPPPRVRELNDRLPT